MTNPWPNGVAAPARRALEGAGLTKLEDLKRVSARGSSERRLYR